MNETGIRAVIGLGNPGREYEKTRHNAGFEMIDALRGAFRAAEGEKAAGGCLYKGRFAGHEILLFKPMTFMNRSGEAVKQLQMLSKIKNEAFLIVYDDLDLPAGEIKLKPAGSAGGHNGMDSIIQCLGSERIPRLRIGIGTEGARHAQVDYVLGTANAEEAERMQVAYARGVEAVKLALSRTLSFAMNHVNTRIRKAETAPDAEKTSTVPNPEDGGMNLE